MEFESQFVQIGSIQIRYYGVIIVTAMIAATFVALNLAKRTGRDPEHIYGALTWAIIPGIIFARLWFVVFPPVSSVNTFVPVESTYTVTATAVLDDANQIAVGVGQLQVITLGENSALEDAGIEAGDTITGIQLPGAEDFSAISDTPENLFSDLDEGAEVILRVERDVPKDRNFFLQNFFDLDNGAIAIWSGGLSIFGALLGGFMGVYFYARRNGLKLGPWLDIAAVVLPLSQSIGRWANYVNQELFGDLVNSSYFLALRIPQSIGEEALLAANNVTSIRDLPFSILDRGAVATSGGEIFYTFHPLFLYESVWSFIAFGVLLWLYVNHRDRFRPGDFFLIYIAQYSAIRFLLEFLRLEVTLVGDLNLSQLVTGVAFVVSIALLFMRLSTRGSDERSYAEIAPAVWTEQSLKAAGKAEKPEGPRKRERKSAEKPAAAKPAEEDSTEQQESPEPVAESAAEESTDEAAPTDGDEPRNPA